MIVIVDNQSLVQDVTLTKQCTGCKRELPLADFTGDKATKDNLSYRCRQCQSNYSKNLRKRQRAKSRIDIYSQVAPQNGVVAQPAPPTPVVKAVQPAGPLPRGTSDIIGIVSMLLEIPRTDCETVLRMVAAYYGTKETA